MRIHASLPPVRVINVGFRLGSCEPILLAAYEAESTSTIAHQHACEIP